MASARASYIPTLDGWRAVAIAAVVLSHSFLSTSWAMHGALGVNLFFALSGFLITFRLLEEHSASGRISLRDFYLRRAFRILPAALFYFYVVGLLAATGVIYVPWRDFASCLFFVRNYAGTGAATGWYTRHFWSLAVEEQFYLFWPALLVFAGVVRSRWIAPGLALAFAVWRSVDTRHGWIASALNDEMLRNNLSRSDYRMDSLLWGCTLGLLAARFDFKRWIPQRAASWLALGAAFTVIAVDIRQPQSYMAIEALLLPLVLIATAMQPGCWLGVALEWAPLRWLGRLSYSVYLWQQLFFSHHHHGLLQRFPVNLLLALACATFSFYGIERPMLRLGKCLIGHDRGQRTKVLINYSEILVSDTTRSQSGVEVH